MLPQKIKVRIALAVDGSGKWNACGFGGPESTTQDLEKMDLAVEGVDDGEARYWLEAEVDLPSGATSVDAVVSPRF